MEDEKTVRYTQHSQYHHGGESSVAETGKIDVFADLEATLDEVAQTNPRVENDGAETVQRQADLRALLEVSMAINASLRLDDVLELIMQKAIELMQAERGLIMLLDETGDLQVRSAYNLGRDQISEDDFRISRNVTSKVAQTGRSAYTSDALEDERYSQFKSVQELHLRSIMCVPVLVESQVIGVIYLDNSSQSKMFLKSDLYLFELYAQMVSKALHNAKMYEELLNLKQFNQSVVQSSPIGIVVLDSEGQILSINSVALEILDLNRDNVVIALDSDEPTRFVDTLPVNQTAPWQTMINAVLAAGQEVENPRYYHDTGYLEKVLSIKITPLHQIPGGDAGLIMALEDVTDKVTMEQYVILSEKLVARGEMAASVAHELNNFLAIIANNAELLQMNIDRKKFEKAAFNSKSINENVFKIKRFVESLMDFSQPDPEYIHYDPRRLIDDLLFSMRIQPRFKLISFSMDLASDIPLIEVDVGQVQQVIMNLLNNAADAISEQATAVGNSIESFEGRISISARWQENTESVTIEIADNGIGMNEETLGRIFSLHFSTKKGGHGLGLYNCRKIVEQHGGQLRASSSPGQGSTFSLVLPRTQKPRSKKV